MTRPRVSLKLRFYRQCRLWHGYLSAFAFAALLFFAVTGVLLNHPTWFAAEEPRAAPVKLTLASSQVEELRSAQVPAQALARMVAEKTTLYGEYEDGETAGEQIFVRLRGARGSSSLRASLRDGTVTVVSERSTTIGLLNALHRGEHTGTAWRTSIDVAAAILIVLALVGYAIFFSMINQRLRTALILTGVSVLGMVMFFAAFAE
jgi:hypothetical protein